MEDLKNVDKLEGCCGVKLFAGSSTGNLLVKDEQDIEKVISNSSKIVSIHSEDEDILNLRKKFIKKGDVSSHPFWRNEECAMSSTRRVMRTLKRFNSEIEIYSIDEAFLDLSNFPDDKVEEMGKEIRSIILQWTGIPTSIGIAKTKTLSKVANHIAKKTKSGVINLTGIKDIDPILEKVEINDIWGVGKQLTKFFVQNGIHNAKQLKNISNTWIKKNSNVLSSRTAMELRGISCIPLETQSSKRKSCVVSRSFAKKVEKLQELQESVTSYCLNAAEKIRSESLIAKSITIFIRTSPFQNQFAYYSNSKTIDLPIATDNSIEIVKTALTGLKYIFKNGYRYQKAGIMLSGLSSSQGSKNLFSSIQDNKIKNLMKSIDNTNYRFGRSTLSLASAGINRKWNIKRQYSSKIDTADFHYLPTIKAI